ncbi:MAG: transposase, partial [Bacteroidia bacterium]|nr:transposase [Bacteroidia bacterium]
WHDYDGGMYFVTICTKDFVHYFGEIERGEMVLNELGEYAVECMENVPTHFSDAEIPLSIIMPNHIHAIVDVEGHRDIGSHSRDAACHVSTINDSQKNEKMQHIAMKCGRLSAVIGGLKSAVTRYANRHNIPFAWQTRFHDRIIRNKEECNRIAEYIENNPANWMSDELNI